MKSAQAVRQDSLQSSTLFRHARIERYTVHFFVFEKERERYVGEFSLILTKKRTASQIEQPAIKNIRCIKTIVFMQM
jgi:hypothetical protein